jgi:hypothetical protein
MAPYPDRESRLAPAVYVTVGLAALVGFIALVLEEPRAGVAGVGLAVALVAALNPRVAIALIIPAIAVSPELPLPLRLKAEDVLMVPLAAGWIAKLLATREREGSPLDRPLWVYFGAAIVGSAWGAYSGYLSMSGNLLTLDQYRSTPLHVIKRLEFVLLYLIIVDSVRTKQQVKNYIYLMMAGMLALAYYGASTVFGGSHIALAPEGAPIHEPAIASMLNIALGLSLLPASRGPGRLAILGLLLFSVYTLPLSLGRNFMIATAVVVAYIGLFHQRWVVGLIPIALFIGGTILPDRVVDRFTTLTGAFQLDPTGEATGGASVLSRLVPPATRGLLAFGYSPFFGFGLAAVPLGFIDSEYATQLVYTGLLGVAAFLAVVVTLVRTARATRVAAEALADPLYLWLARGFQCCLLAYGTFSVFSPSISASRAGGFFFVLVGLMSVLHRTLARELAERPPVAAAPPDAEPVSASARRTAPVRPKRALFPGRAAFRAADPAP